MPLVGRLLPFGKQPYETATIYVSTIAEIKQTGGDERSNGFVSCSATVSLRLTIAFHAIKLCVTKLPGSLAVQVAGAL